MTIYLVRHGETRWNREGRLQGRLDSGLTSQGVMQANCCSRFFSDKNIQMIFSSPTKRAIETIRPFVKNNGLQINKKDGLMECCFGDLEGKTYLDAEKIHPGFAHKLRTDPRSLTVPNAENVDSFIKRVIKTFEKIVSQSSSMNTLVVTHGGVISVIVRSLMHQTSRTLSETEPVANGSISILTNKNQSIFLNTFNSIAHLNDEN